MGFDHDNLDVYDAALDLVVVADEVAREMPRGRAYLADQLRRAGTSVALNIAEGAGEFAPKDKARFYRIARRSATECAAILDVCRKLDIGRGDLLDKGRQLLLRLVSMLIKLARAREELSGTGTGTE